jgi:hypothetical protein
MLQATRAISSRAAYMLEQAVKRSRRGSGIQLPTGFVRADAYGMTPPLARMMRGGRGGEVRLKLYLTMILIAVRPPHDINNVPARAWAEVLDLEDPPGLGARRISDALQWLAMNKFVRLDSQRGRPPVVTLLSALGDESRFDRGRGIYVRVPIGLWQSFWITQLTGSGLALLLVLLDLQSGRKASAPPALPGPMRRRYGLSDDTWTRASKELSELGLLEVRRQPQGRDFDARRMRNTYWIDVERLNLPPDKSPLNSDEQAAPDSANYDSHS